jgi:hypothetical protein
LFSRRRLHCRPGVPTTPLSRCWLGLRCTRLGGAGESFLRVHWVAVPKAMRARRANRGLGQRLYDHAEAYCRAEGSGYARVWLETSRRQKAARRLYLRSGFVVIEEVDNVRGHCQRLPLALLLLLLLLLAAGCCLRVRVEIMGVIILRTD